MMDIQGLVNHTNTDNRRLGSLSPPDRSGSESARSHYPAVLAVLQPSPYSLTHHDRDGMYSPQYPAYSFIDRTTAPIKRQLDGLSPTSATHPAKRRASDTNGENGRALPTRRRALQACESCRSKKSKCDNERPSCGSCSQHGIDCVYKGAPLVPV